MIVGGGSPGDGKGGCRKLRLYVHCKQKKAAPSSLGDAALHFVALPPAGDYFTTLRPFWMKMPFWALFTRTPLRL